MTSVIISSLCCDDSLYFLVSSYHYVLTTLHYRLWSKLLHNTYTNIIRWLYYTPSNTDLCKVMITGFSIKTRRLNIAHETLATHLFEWSSQFMALVTIVSWRGITGPISHSFPQFILLSMLIEEFGVLFYSSRICVQFSIPRQGTPSPLPLY